MIDVQVELARRPHTLCFQSDGELTALHGPSGSGKTTLLRVIAGLEKASARGCVRFSGETWQDDERGLFVPAHARRIGWVPQDALLFPHLSVRANLLFSDHAREARLAAIADLVEIGHLLNRSPRALSGGERQRVALGRALLSEPELLLLDEAFSALHKELKLQLLSRVSAHCRREGVAVLMVTHQLEDAARFGCTSIDWDSELDDPEERASHAPLLARPQPSVPAARVSRPDSGARTGSRLSPHPRPRPPA